ncbi:MAG TPA: class III extradiol ring-cleavage dioxygenase [Bacillota bacterium]|nr:class III extradiol ring-cleavage dioxygenase [Bacillota bacterium]
MSRMPVVFVGHGSPMNAIEDNAYSRGWREMAKRIPKPKAIVSVSAHWYTRGTRIMDEENPEAIYDMYGFPKELYEVTYNAPGSPEIAKAVKELISREIQFDNSWGIDHGTWSVLVHMYLQVQLQRQKHHLGLIVIRDHLAPQLMFLTHHLMSKLLGALMPPEAGMRM